MTGAVRNAAKLPVIVAGAGPAGAATALGLHAAGEAVVAFESRGQVATRARNIFLRPQARDILQELGMPRLGRDTTIMHIENSLRGLAKERGVPISYGHKVLDVVERADHVAVTIEGPRGGIRTVKGRVFVDASGGRLPATQDGRLERVATSPSHVYVTAQYDGTAPFGKVYGVYDDQLDEGMFFFPLQDRKGFVAYYDLPVGRPIGDEAALLARYDTLAGQLQLGTPISRPQAFDAQQHLSRNAHEGRILKIGDTAGNADPYIGAGTAAALVDARAAIRALSSGEGTDAQQVARAAEDVLDGHRNLGKQAGLMVDIRGIGLRSLGEGHFDHRLKPSDLDDSWLMDLTARALTSMPILT